MKKVNLTRKNKKATPKSKSTSPKVSKKKPASNKPVPKDKLDIVLEEVQELKELIGSPVKNYQKQEKVKAVLEQSGLDSAETIKVNTALRGIIWGE